MRIFLDEPERNISKVCQVLWFCIVKNLYAEREKNFLTFLFGMMLILAGKQINIQTKNILSTPKKKKKMNLARVPCQNRMLKVFFPLVLKSVKEPSLFSRYINCYFCSVPRAQRRGVNYRNCDLLPVEGSHRSISHSDLFFLRVSLKFRSEGRVLFTKFVLRNDVLSSQQRLFQTPRSPI